MERGSLHTPPLQITAWLLQGGVIRQFRLQVSMATGVICLFLRWYRPPGPIHISSGKRGPESRTTPARDRPEGQEVGSAMAPELQFSPPWPPSASRTC